MTLIYRHFPWDIIGNFHAVSSPVADRDGPQHDSAPGRNHAGEPRATNGNLLAGLESDEQFRDGDALQEKAKRLEINGGGGEPPEPDCINVSPART